MEFYTASALKRPVRLCEKTRKFAYDSLNHIYGLDTAKTDSISMDGIDGFENMSSLDKYDTVYRQIALNAPIRICPDEMISGAATLGKGIRHRIPFSHKTAPDIYSISHLTVDFETVLKRGINGIYADVEKSLSLHRAEPDKTRFLESCKSVLDSMKIWHRRYTDALSKMKGYENNYKNLLKVPFEPAQNFYEAVQSIWFVFAFLRLGGNWPGFGRLDVLLGGYLKKDLSNGVITLDEAREILAHFFIKGCEWVKGGDYGSGDAQHYQNIVLSGIGDDGKDVTNEVTYLVLDIIEELGISDFPTTVRLNANTDEKLLLRCSEVLKFGGGILAFYNEDLILKALTGYGYAYEEAVKFANDGCWEVQVPGKTNFSYIPFDSLELLQKKTLKGYEKGVDYASFEELYENYRQALHEKIGEISESIEPLGAKKKPCTAVSLFERGCIEKAKSYLEGGPVYNVVSPHIGGLPDAVNSLYAIKKTVYDDKKLTLPEFVEVLCNNWDNNEPLRRQMLEEYSYYGNDNDECDAIAVRIIDDFAAACRDFDKDRGYFFPAGVSTFGRQLEWSVNRLATSYGRKKGEVLAGNFSPTPGTDKEGATAIIRSYCKADLTKTVTGAALDIKLLPKSTQGEDGTLMLVSLLKAFVKLGGFFIQPDVQDAEILHKAQLCPENYQTLSVRVSGWNARFVTLNKEWQDMLIDENS